MARSIVHSDKVLESFQADASVTFEDGRRILVPVLGTGFRKWMLGELSYPKALTSWGDLLSGVAYAAGVREPLALKEGAFLTAVWEEVVARYTAIVPNRQFAQVENSLIVQHVARWLDARVDQLGPQTEDRRNAFLNLSFSDVVDLSIEKLLVRDDFSLAKGNGRSRAPSSDRWLCKRACEKHRWPTVWCPHGTTGNPRRIVLGVQRYGRHIAEMINSLDIHKNWEKKQKKLRATPVAGEILDLNLYRYNTPSHKIEHWVAKTLNAPWWILGAGVGPDEWDLWFYLQIRRRNHRALGEHSPRAYRLTCTEEMQTSSWAKTSAAFEALGVSSLLCGEKWADAWSNLFSTMQNEPDRRGALQEPA